MEPKVKWLLLTLLLAAGCSQRIRVRSQPSTADILLPDGRRLLTPAQFRLKRTPFRAQLAEVTAVGYRPMIIDLRRRGSRRDLYVVLVPEHGPAGSWTESETPGGGE